ncbi:hypothetical protein TNCV_4289941 [Trichonephila clavipes]|nr:hypothetical protein TNCV_4289941 [Trichonephila clavipes]
MKFTTAEWSWSCTRSGVESRSKVLMLLNIHLEEDLRHINSANAMFLALILSQVWVTLKTRLAEKLKHFITVEVESLVGVEAWRVERYLRFCPCQYIKVQETRSFTKIPHVALVFAVAGNVESWPDHDVENEWSLLEDLVIRRISVEAAPSREITTRWLHYD